MCGMNKGIEPLQSLRSLRKTNCIFPLVVWMWCKSFKTGYISEVLEMSPRSVDGYLRYIRSRIEDPGPTYEGQLSGVVHVDAWTYKPRLNLAPPKRSYPPRRPILLGMLSAEGQLRLFVISSKSRREIYPLIKMHIARDTTVITNKSNLYIELRKDGYPGLIQMSSSELKSRWAISGDVPNINVIWDRIICEMATARGVRATNFLSRVREVELRWLFRELPNVRLYNHVMART